MNYILDTHTFLWSIFNSKRLPTHLKEIILNSDNSIYISSITFWEISLKYSLGKLELENVLPDDLPSVSKEAGFEILDITFEELASFYKLPAIGHKDPFDRLIIWQAINNDITVISQDIKFQDYKKFGLKIIW